MRKIWFTVPLITAALMTAPMAASASADMTASSTAESIAQTEPVYALSVRDMSDSLYKGHWVTAEFGYKMFLPDAWTMQEDAEGNGTVFEAQSKDQTQGMAVSKIETDQIFSQQALFGRMGQIDGLTDITMLETNGIETVTFTQAKEDVKGIAFADGDTLYTMAFTPASDSSFNLVSTQIVASLQKVKDTADSTAESAAESWAEPISIPSVESLAESAAASVSESVLTK